MLVLTRRLGEEIVIAGDIRVVVVSIQGGKVRLGIRAPDDVRVDRQEIHARRAEWEADARQPVCPPAHRIGQKFSCHRNGQPSP
jgi:carbon storage regulator CsrA